MTAPALVRDEVAAVAEVSAQALHDLQLGLDELRTSAGAYRKAGRYHRGDIPERFASARLRRAMAANGVGFKFNFAKTSVDAIADRLEIASVTSVDKRAAQLLTRLWEDNELDLEAPQIHRKTGTYGDSYAIVWPLDDPDDDTDPADGRESDPAATRIGIFYNSPEQCRVLYDTEYPRRIRFAIKRWQLAPETEVDPARDKPPVRVDLLYADRIERYITRRGRTGQSARDFTRYLSRDDRDQDQPWPVPNPFGRVPVFHFRNDRPYGVPDHYGFYGPQDAINKLIISHMSGVDYQSFPQRYALVTADSDTTEAAALDEDDFVLDLDQPGEPSSARVDADSTYSADPGSLWLMRGVSGVGQFAVADPRAFLDPMVTYIKSGAQITGTPLHYFDVSGQVPSGESLRAAEAPHNKRIRFRQLSYGATWRELFVFALRILGVTDPQVKINWVPPQTVDDATGWQTITAKLGAGVPPRQVFLEAGYTDQEVDAWERSGGHTGMDLDSLLQIAQILTALGTAVSMGVIDRATVDRLIEQVLPDDDRNPEGEST